MRFNLLIYSLLILLIAPTAFAFQLFPESVQQRGRRVGPYVPGVKDPITPSNPVVLIPGDGGSRLEVNLTGKPSVPHYLCASKTSNFSDLWLDLTELLPWRIDCWSDNMRLIFNETTLQSNSPPGVDIRVPGFADTYSVEWLDSSNASQGLYFASIADALRRWGYKPGLNMMGAPFDWRKAPHQLDEYFINLKTIIEILYRYNNNQRVVVLAHSMGSPIMNYFYHNYVTQQWKDQFIEYHISLSGAWGGSMTIVKLFASGYNMDHYRALLPPSSLRAMQRSFTSSAFLFPSRHLWEDNEVFAHTFDRNYTFTDSDIHQFFVDAKYPLGYSQYTATKDALMIEEAPGVEVHCLYGTGIDTPEDFYWAKGSFPDSQPTVVMGEGDGTVNIRSLDVCKGWNSGNNAGNQVHVHELAGTDHLGILWDGRTIELLRVILYKESPNATRPTTNSTNTKS